MKDLIKKKPAFVVFGFYTIIFALFFLHLPLHGRLPGNTDTLLAISLSNILFEKIKLFFAGSSGFTSLYPAPNPLAYGENCYGLGIPLMILNILMRSDIWGYYLFITLVFVLNSFGLFKLTGLFVKNPQAALLSGLVYSLAGFTLSNIDDPNVIFIFLPALSLYFLEKAVRTESKSYLKTGLFLAGLQIWFGFYIFVFLFLVLILFFGIHFRSLKAIWSSRNGVDFLLSYLGPAAPLVALYLYNDAHAGVFWRDNNPHIVETASISWYHFKNVLANNLIYSDAKNVYQTLDDSGWIRIRKNCFPGILLPLFAGIGIISTWRKTPLLFAVFALFFSLSFGIHLPFFKWLIRLPFGKYFRVPLRFYLIALVPLAVYFSIGVEWLLKRTRLAPRIAACSILVIGFFFFMENVPFPLAAYDYKTTILPPLAYQTFFSGLKDRKIVLDLPSSCIYRPRSKQISELETLWYYNREILYMNWQTYHEQVIVGGVNGYLPISRVEMDKDIQLLPDEDALQRIQKSGVHYIAFHKNLVLTPEEDILEKLKKSSALKTALEEGDLTLFEMKE